jgi:acetyl-CoA carboxylase alpha subunit
MQFLEFEQPIAELEAQIESLKKSGAQKILFKCWRVLARQ